MITQEQMDKLADIDDAERRAVLADLRRLLGIHTFSEEPGYIIPEPLTITLEDWSSGDVIVTGRYATRSCKDRDVPAILRCTGPHVLVTQARPTGGDSRDQRGMVSRTVEADALLREYVDGGGWAWWAPAPTTETQAQGDKHGHRAAARADPGRTRVLPRGR